LRLLIRPEGRWQARGGLGHRPRPRAPLERSWSTEDAGTGRINVNTASQAELEALPGIGPVIGRRIVEGRPYRSVEDLDRVKGIGSKRLEEIRPLVTAE
jgi:competence ComEA-like helix-hairpin-helix protein